MSENTRKTGCCVVGGGPAGMMFGFLLARGGVQVTVLEKHRDFNRDFRGDTVHPSTLDVFEELGLLDEFLRLPHQKVETAGGYFGEVPFQAADFTHLRTRCKFIALMPQWDLLNFVAAQAQKLPNFILEMEHEAKGLTFESGRVSGVEARTPAGTVTVRADLVVACDGRHSTIRNAARMDVIEAGVPIDVLWFRIRRQQGDSEQLLGRVNYGKALVLINRGDYFQAGLIVRKGSFPELQEEGLERFRESIARIAPFLGDRVTDLTDWDQVKLLTVQINRLRKWHRPGLLFIGDSAHAMSPAGGVGINLAIQDAVAASRILVGTMRDGRFPDRQTLDRTLGQVERRREFPTRITQAVQKKAHEGLSALFAQSGPLKAPWAFRVATRIPGVQRINGRVIGVGVRPEHVTEKPRWPLALALAFGAAALATVYVRRNQMRPTRSATI